MSERERERERDAKNGPKDRERKVRDLVLCMVRTVVHLYVERFSYLYARYTTRCVALVQPKATHLDLDQRSCLLCYLFMSGRFLSFLPQPTRADGLFSQKTFFHLLFPKPFSARSNPHYYPV